jgi:predicted nucleic acid-binding protein
VKFWDSSAIVPLVTDEPGREPLLSLLEQDPVMAIWWATPVEVTSAVARCEREGTLDLRAATQVLQKLRTLDGAWHQVLPGDALRGTAQRLLRVHPLRAADSLQLAAALTVADGDPGALEFVSLDQRLADAARKEGLNVLAL